MKLQMFTRLGFLFLALNFNANMFASNITAGGTVNSNTTWNVDTVLVTSNISIANGANLSINSGTQVIFTGHYSIYVKGAIQAIGAVNDTILFTATNTSTGWDGIQIDAPSSFSNDSNIFSFCRFEHAKRSLTTYGSLNGGALSIYFTTEIRVSNCHFLFNEVIGSNANGAAISVNTNVYPCSFNHNVFNNNTSTSAIVYFYGSSVRFNNNSLYNNSCAYGTLVITICNGEYMSNFISNNSASFFGGGVIISGEKSGYPIKFYNNVVVNNTAQRGGGLYISSARAEIYNNTIVNNEATYASYLYSGGGVFLSGNADADFKSNIIYGNWDTSVEGHQICLNDLASDPKFYNCNIEGGRTSFSGPGSGVNYSGIFTENIDTNPYFVSSSAGVGASYNGRAANWSIAQGSQVINGGYGNSSNFGLPEKDMAGEIRIFNGRVDMGAYENQDSIIATCNINSNTVWSADTIWVRCDVTVGTGATLSIRPGTHVIFMGYYRIQVEGNILALGSADKNIEFTVMDTIGLYNPNSIGGAWNGIEFNNVLLSEDSSKFEYCKFYYAKATYITSNQQSSGGAMNIYNSSKVAIENCLFSNNISLEGGSALYVESSNIVFRNNIVCNNSALGTYGNAAVHFDDVTTDFLNNTITNNFSKYIAGLYAYSSSLNIKNCLFWGNVKGAGGFYASQLALVNNNNSKMYNNNVQYSISSIWGNSFLQVDQDNISIDPQFVNPTTGVGIMYDGVHANWALTSNSPLVDRGFYYSSKTNSDFAGNPRVIGDTIDIGAFEVQLSPKFITKQPISKSVCETTSSSFSVGASINVNYQWVHNGSPIPGANNAVYNDSSASVIDTGYYYCILSTPNGIINSDTALFDIQFAPNVISSPNSTSACIGDTAVFGIAATGSEPMLYAWENSLGQLSSPVTYGVTNVGIQASSNAPNGYPSTFANWYWGSKYQFIIRAAELSSAGLPAGNINSIAFNVLSVNSCPALSNYSVSVGNTTASSVSSFFINGLTSVYSVASYQPINGWNTITFQNAYFWDGTSNIVIQICSNNSSYVNSGNASIALASTSYNSSVEKHADVPNICSQTKGVLYPRRPVVRIDHGNNSNLHYYYIDSVMPSNASVYKCNVSNMCGSALSVGAQLVVNSVPSVVPIISTASICENQSYTYSTSATGSSPITYQWYHDGSAISGSTSISHSISSASNSSDGVYYCKVTNTCGNDSTNQSVLTVNMMPSIISQPTASQTLCENQTASLAVTASGLYPITFQWYKAGAPIAGAISPSYYISPIAVSDAGIYKCIATNSCGNDQSNNVTIAVNSPPSITYQSTDSIRCEGGQMSFDLTAVGTVPITYQWFKGSASVSGANSNLYFLNNLIISDAEFYHCVITNSCATVTSTNKHLTVNPNPQVSLGNDTSFCLGGSTTIGPGYGYFCLWNNGSYNNQLTVTNSGSYFVNVTDQNGCSGISDTINVNVLSPYSNQEICIVTVDSATGKNAIVWSKTPNQSITSFMVYKESSISGIYNIIANQPYDSLSVVIDNTSSPSVKPERYVITVVDSCGNESAVSPEHRTMHLTVNKGQNNDWNLIWNAYEGFTPSSYKIFRADSTLNYTNISTVSGSSSYTYLYTDQTALANKAYYYYVEVVHPNGGCTATKGTTNYNSSRSNRANNGTANPTNLVPAFFGTPTSGKFPLDVHFFDQSIGSPIEWEWDFGDGNVDSVQNPVHSYTQIGVYTVSLIVKDAGSMNSVTFQNYITVLTTGMVELDDEFVVKVFPNPYSEKTSIAYALANQTKVVMEVYTSQGQKVAELINAEQSAGSYKVQFRAADYGFASGVYILRMKVGDQLITKKLIEVK